MHVPAELSYRAFLTPQNWAPTQRPFMRLYENGSAELAILRTGSSGALGCLTNRSVTITLDRGLSPPLMKVGSRCAHRHDARSL